MCTRFLDRQSTGFVVVALMLLILASALRFPHADWDGGHQLHPDERSILFVEEDVASGYMNPFRTPEGEQRLYPYGHLPLYVNVGASWLLGQIRLPCNPASFCGRLTNLQNADSFTHLTYVGRASSALYDTFTVLATILLAKRLMARKIGSFSSLLAGGLSSLAVLHIQNAHFGTVDTALTLFCTLALGSMVDYTRTRSQRAGVMAGIWTGLAVGSKATGILLLLPLTLAHMGYRPRIHVKNHIVSSTLAMIAAFFMTNPFVALDPVSFVRSWTTQVAVTHGWIDWPFARQYIGTLPLVYMIEQQARWSLSFPFTLAAYIGLGWAGRKAWNNKDMQWAIVVIWIIAGLLTLGTQLVKFPRYMLPFTPMLAICAASWIASQSRALRVALSISTLIPTAVYALAFFNMYRTLHPWIAASEWLYETIPPDATLAVEYWDDPLPLPLHGQPFTSVVLDPFDEPDDEAKLEALMASLEEADYIILSSNRLYGTIPRLSERYPLTSAYYRALFAGDMGFEFERAFFRYPNLLGISLVDDPFHRAGLTTPLIDWPGDIINLGFADESFTVYDHPLVLVFRRAEEAGQ
jgi:hypothetical protein